jgi:hypothetical protein
MTSRPPLSSPLPSLSSSSSLQINSTKTTTGGKLSLFRTHRYQSWRSALGRGDGGRGGGGGGAKEGENENEGAKGMRVGEQQQRIKTIKTMKPSSTVSNKKKESREPRGARVITAGFATFPFNETTQLKLTPATSASSSARIAAPPAATAASTPTCPVVGGGTVITATPEARRVMRHISGLGMEDPTMFVANANHVRGMQVRQRAADTDPMRFTEDHHGPVDDGDDAAAAAAAEVDADASLRLFQDMRIEDMPLDMRSAMSVESDPTATFSCSNGGVDVQMFHSSLGHITGWLPLPPLDDINKEANDNKVSKVKQSATSQQEELDTEQLLQSLPCDDDDPPQEVVNEAADASKQGSGTTKNVLCDAMIEQALLGASLNSLQSLSLDELQMHSSLGNFANPRVFLAAAPSESSDEGGGGGAIKRSDRHSRRALTTARSVARIAGPTPGPPGSPTRVESRRRHAAGSNPAYRSPSDWKDRLHQSMPMNVKLTGGGSGGGGNGGGGSGGKYRDPAAASEEVSSNSISSRPAKPEWKAPPSVVALSRSSMTLSHDAGDDRAATKGGGGDKCTGVLKAHEEEPQHHPSTLSPSLTRPAAAVVIIPKKRALPSIQCLFPEDSAPPSTTATTMTATMASC